MSEDSRAWKDQYMLRFPDGMRDALKQSAARNSRSLNAEIIQRLAENVLLTGEVARLKAKLRDAEELIAFLKKPETSASLSKTNAWESILPKGLASRIESQSKTNKRTVEEEVIQALEKAFPLPSADEMISVWSAILETFSGAKEAGLPVVSDDQSAMVDEVNEMLQFLRDEKAAGRGGDLSQRYFERMSEIHKSSDEKREE